jgi:hypothetical protein
LVKFFSLYKFHIEPHKYTVATISPFSIAGNIIMKVQNGKPYLDFKLPSVEGNEISLSQVLEDGYHTVVVFLRHLG